MTVIQTWYRDKSGRIQQWNWMSAGDIPKDMGFSRDPLNVPAYVGPWPPLPVKPYAPQKLEPPELLPPLPKAPEPAKLEPGAQITGDPLPMPPPNETRAGEAPRRRGRPPKQQ